MVYYLGSKNTLGHYANTKLLDGDPRRIAVEDNTPDEGFNPNGAAAYAGNRGRSICIEHVPTRIEWQERGPVPDVDNQHGILVIPEQFREIVEHFEPGIHQFLPVCYVSRTGNELAQRYYFIACNRLDSVDPFHSTMILMKRTMWRPVSELIRLRSVDEIPVGFDVDAEPRIVFSNSQIGEKHAWADKFLPLVGPMLSDTLGTALMAESFSGIALTKAEAI